MKTSSIVASILAATASAVLVPGPTGPYSVANKVVPITDYSRIDPYAKPGENQIRRVLLSFYLPVHKSAKCSNQTVPYMTPAVIKAYNSFIMSYGLPDHLFDELQFQFCDLSKLRPCERRHSSATGSRFPVVLFSPGMGNSRLIYTARLASLASQGYIVVSMDHPYDANVVEFPDGTTYPARAEDDTIEHIEQALAVRSDDVAFIVSQLQNSTLMKPLLEDYPGSLDLNRLVAFGHSLGGTTSASAARREKKILGGADLDGQFVNPIMSQGLDKPFMLMGVKDHAGHDDTWNIIWPKLQGKKVQLEINGTTHGTFEDLPTLVPLMNLPPQTQGPIAMLLGTVTWQDAHKSIEGGLIAFFNLVLYGKSKELKEIEQKFPNITIARSAL